MKTISVLSALFVLAGCASSSDALIKRRDEIRRLANAPVNENYRSADGVRGTTWGMTPEEVIAVKGEPELRSENVLMYHDQIDTLSQPTTYGFFEGHLAVVKTHFDQVLEGTTRLQQGLTVKYGEPSAIFNKYDDTQNAVAAATAVDVTLSVLLAVGSIASHHHSGYPYLYGPRLGEAEFVHKSLENANKPALLVTWQKPETRVHLTAFDSGATDVTWTSRELGGRFAKQQASAAGLEDLSKDL